MFSLQHSAHTLNRIPTPTRAKSSARPTDGRNSLLYRSRVRERLREAKELGLDEKLEHIMRWLTLDEGLTGTVDVPSSQGQ
jgi:hypothetical protein